METTKGNQSNWDDIKTKVKRNWSSFTDEELDQTNGNRKELSGALQRKMGLSPEEAEERLDRIFNGSGETAPDPAHADDGDWKPVNPKFGESGNQEQGTRVKSEGNDQAIH